MKLSTALASTTFPGGFIIPLDSMESVGYFIPEEHGFTRTLLSPLGKAHLVRYKMPGLFDMADARFEGDRATIAERITRDLLHAWPELGLRVRNIPNLAQILRIDFQLPFKSRDWTLARVIEHVGLGVVKALKEVRL